MQTGDPASRWVARFAVCFIAEISSSRKMTDYQLRGQHANLVKMSYDLGG